MPSAHTFARACRRHQTRTRHFLRPALSLPNPEQPPRACAFLAPGLNEAQPRGAHVPLPPQKPQVLGGGRRPCARPLPAASHLVALVVQLLQLRQQRHQARLGPPRARVPAGTQAPNPNLDASARSRDRSSAASVERMPGGALVARGEDVTWWVRQGRALAAATHAQRAMQSRLAMPCSSALKSVMLPLTSRSVGRTKLLWSSCAARHAQRARKCGVTPPLRSTAGHRGGRPAHTAIRPRRPVQALEPRDE